MNPVSISKYCGADEVFCSPAASISWGGDPEWERIYGHMNMPVPTERINLLRRRKKWTFLPYYSAGMVGFPEQTKLGMRFGEVWHDTARQIDTIEDLDGRRPYLDQMSLPLAIQRSGFKWHPLADPFQYILGGRIRGKPLPDYEISAIHYRWPELLTETGANVQALETLREMAPKWAPEEFGMEAGWLRPNEVA